MSSEFALAPKPVEINRINTSNQCFHTIIDEETTQMNESQDATFKPAN
jgi:hypothetical protein